MINDVGHEPFRYVQEWPQLVSSKKPRRDSGIFDIDTGGAKQVWMMFVECIDHIAAAAV